RHPSRQTPRQRAAPTNSIVPFLVPLLTPVRLIGLPSFPTETTRCLIRATHSNSPTLLRGRLSREDSTRMCSGPFAGSGRHLCPSGERRRSRASATTLAANGPRLLAKARRSWSHRTKLTAGAVLGMVSEQRCGMPEARWIMLRTALILALVLLAAPVAGVLPPGAPSPQLRVPSERTIPAGPVGEAVLDGRQVLTQTQGFARAYVGNGLNCSSCDLGSGAKGYGRPLVGV